VIVNNELKKMRKKTAAIRFHILTSSSPGGTDRNCDIFNSVFSMPLPRMKPGTCRLQDIRPSDWVNLLGIFNDVVSTVEFTTA
jgi:hypothetical protein